ncbi:MAG TPA: hypothetical protein VJG83_06675 [archaeon]|nr:hypothetical protein [archaeon]
MKSLFILFAAVLLFSFAGAGQLNILGVANESTIPQVVYSGDLVTFTFDVQNVSGVGRVAEDVNVFIELNENYFMPVKVSEFIGDISSKGSKTVSLRFNVTEAALPGNYKMPVFLSYSSGSSLISQVEEVDLEISSCKVLKIDDISLSSSTPHIGTTLDVLALIKNSCASAARDVSVSLVPVTNSTIAPFIVTSGTLKKIGGIMPGESETVKFSIDVSGRVKSGAYVFSIDANCGTCEKSSTNNFSFLVLGKPELIFSNIEYSVDVVAGNDKIILQGSTFTLSVQVDNIGDESAKAVEVSIDYGNSLQGTSKSFVGNIDPQDSGAAIFNLTASPVAKPGAIPGKITVSYIDELGQRQSIEYGYDIYISELPSVSPIVYIFILILIIVALAILYFIIKFIFRQLAIRAQSR